MLWSIGLKPEVGLRNNQWTPCVLRIYNLLCTCFEALDQITCLKGIKLFLEVSKANTCLAMAHSSMALQVTGAFCILIAGFRANSQVTHFCPKSNIASCSLFNVRQHCQSSTKSLVTFPFLAQAVPFLVCFFLCEMYHL